jgi:protein TonB
MRNDMNNTNRENITKILCFVFVAIVHLALLFLIVFDIDIQELLPAPPPEILKLTSVEEELPPPPPNIPLTNTMETVAEKMLVTENEASTRFYANVAVVEEAAKEVEYLPQHKISVVPAFDRDELRRRIVYPEIAKRSGVEGVVLLELFIDAAGEVKRIYVIKEDPHGRGFAKAAVAAFEGAKAASPAFANGLPVACRFRYPVRFRLT